MRILHGPVNVGNQPWALSRAERRLGVASDLVVRSGTWLNYPADRTLSRDGASLSEIGVRSVLFGLGVPWKYDVLHFYFGQTFLSPGRSFFKKPLLERIYDHFSTIDLRVAKLLGRKMFMTLQGCDARLAGEGNLRNDWTMCATDRCSLYQSCIEALDARRRHMISEVLPFFDRVFYVNPELGHVVPEGQFLPYASVEIEKFDVTLPSPEGRPRIVHAPSNGSIKGTPMILDALEQLKNRYAFDLILVEKKTHEEALALYRSADIAIDQVLAGWYGGFAVEMMAMGKPVACYIREQDMKFVPSAMRDDMPILKINPGRLVDDLATLLDRRNEWQDIARKSRRYVERWHNPDHIARAMLDAYRTSNSTFRLTPGVANVSSAGQK